MAGEIVSGDDAFILEIERGILAAIVDVLGHGEEANALAIRIRAFLTGIGSDALVDVLSRLHQECRGSRGAAVGLCFVEPATGRLRFSGIGNTVFRRFGEVETRLVSRDGTVGGTMRTPVEETLQLSDGDVIVMNTDGVDSHFAASAYPRLRHGPGPDGRSDDRLSVRQIARRRVLHRAAVPAMIEFGVIRIRDDASLVEARNKLRRFVLSLEVDAITATRIAVAVSSPVPPDDAARSRNPRRRWRRVERRRPTSGADVPGRRGPRS